MLKSDFVFSNYYNLNSCDERFEKEFDSSQSTAVIYTARFKHLKTFIRNLEK